MLVTGIKSKPVYTPLSADTRGRHHLMLGMGVGDSALLRVLAEMQSSAPRSLGATRVLLVPAKIPGTADPAAEPRERFDRLGLQELRLFTDVPSLLAQFRSILEHALMGTRLYVAGPESFIGLAMKIALEFNLNKDEIRAEELGTLARRVYCIHCRATTEDVRTNIVRCIGCERWLLVRDHYSRRLAAYMGVMVDAEAPGELPPIREVFV
jgi:hypothetical protein